MTTFAAAIDAIFGNPHMARDAIWRAGGAGDGAAIRVVTRRPDDLAAFNGGRFVVDAVFIDMRLSEVADLNPGDTIEIAGAGTYEIHGEPRRDGERLVWQAEGRLVAA